ncbi:hypothetical protein [Lysobacter sp. HA18]
MQVLILVVAFIALLAFSPVAAAKLAAWIAATTTATRFSTAAVAQEAPGWGASLRAVAWSSLLPVIVLFAFSGFALGTGGVHLATAATLAFAGVLFAAYVLGFRLALGLDMKASAIVALVASVVSVAVVLVLH